MNRNTDPSLSYFGYETDYWHVPSLDPLNSETLRTPGPLMTSAIALFGNYSFYNYTSTILISNILSSNSTATVQSALANLSTERLPVPALQLHLPTRPP